LGGGGELLTNVRVVCPRIKLALTEGPGHVLRVPDLLILGLARANKSSAESRGVEPACEMLVIGWARDGQAGGPDACTTLTRKRLRSPQHFPATPAADRRSLEPTAAVDPAEAERRKKRVLRFGKPVSSSSNL